MAQEQNNVLIQLHNLCGKQDENFITESFVNLLRLLRDYDSINASLILKKITNNLLYTDDSNISKVDINTQITIDSGRPDIEIRFGDYIIFIEVKVKSDFGSTQLDRYNKYLKNINHKKTSLITITKDPFKNGSNSIKPTNLVRWHEIHSWFIELHTKNKIVSYNINQFVEFMVHRGLSMDYVKWEMTEGLKSFKNLMDMIGESLSSLQFRFKTAVAWEWYGYYIDESKYWIGTVFDKPHIILFHTESFGNADNTNVDVGVIANSRWENRLDLSSEDTHFFACSKESQISLIDDFVKKSINYATKITK